MTRLAHVKKQIPEGSAVTGYLSHLTTYGIFKDNWSDNKEIKQLSCQTPAILTIKTLRHLEATTKKLLDLFGNDRER
jgi:hypothetical protein